MNFSKNEYFEKFNYIDNFKRVKKENVQSKKIWIKKNNCFASFTSEYDRSASS